MSWVFGKVFGSSGESSTSGNNLQQTFFTDDEGNTSMSYRTRITFFAACFLTGAFFCWLSLFFLVSIHTFAAFYTIGNALILAATAFLVGPVKQFKKLREKGRIASFSIYIGSLICTLVVAFTISGFLGFILVLCCLVVQIIAMVWYTLSYIPFGQNMMKKAFGWETMEG